MIVVPWLEWHAAHACNLSCEGCSHLSEFPHNEIVSLETLKIWYSKWNKRISPQNMAILGGEPLLNKEIVDIIYMTRDMWNQEYNQYFELVTNGFLLDRYKNLPRALKETNCVLSISIHHYGTEYQKQTNKILSLVDKWKDQHDITVKIYYDNQTPQTTWRKFFKFADDNIEPYHDNDIESSWKYCLVGQECWQLFEGNIYKCAPIAYINLHKKKFGLSKNWDPYLKYKPLTPDSTDEEIVDFFKKKAESCCGMCPSQPPQIIEKPDPILRKKIFKIKKLSSYERAVNHS